MYQSNIRFMRRYLGLIMFPMLLMSFGEQVEISPQTFVDDYSIPLLRGIKNKTTTPTITSRSYMFQEASSHNQAENPVSGIIYTLSDHSCTVDAVDFSPDGRTLVSGGGCGDIIVYNIRDGLKIKSWKSSSWTIKKIAFGLKGSIIASGSGPGTLIKIYDSDSFLLQNTLSNPREYGGVETLIFSSDGQTINSGDSFGTIFSWELTNYTNLNSWVGNFDDLYCLVFNPQGTIIASGTYTGTIKLWNASDGTLLKTIAGHSNGVSSLCFSPDSTLLASGSYGSVKLWNVTDGTIIDTLIGHTNQVYSLNFQPGGEFLASGSSSGVIKIWDLTNGSLLVTLNEHTDYIYGLNFHPDGLTLASASSDHTI